ncbi:MAG: DoxX family protein [Microbacteriaceae bacterium]|nr:DoxX family protein [Microbacteriaceae bacterium]
MGIGKLLLRIVLGTVFVAHGTQKLFGWFGGGGLEGTEKMVAAQRMNPPRRNALAVALAETLGGVGIALGAATPVATAAVTAAMATAFTKVHGKNGFFNSNRGYEFNLTLVAGAAAVTIDGPGPLSVDAVAGKSRWGLFAGLAALGAGWLASSFAIELGELETQRLEASGKAAG